MNRKNPGTLRTGLIFLIFTLFLILSSCDMGSYNPVARALDPFEPLGENAAVWMNVSGSSSDSDRFARFLILQEGSPTPGDIGSYVYMVIHDQSSSMDKYQTEVILTRGTYMVKLTGSSITLYPIIDYFGYYKTAEGTPAGNPPPVDRQGETLPPQSYSENDAILTIGGSDYTAIQGTNGVLNDIYTMSTPQASDAQEQAEELMMLYQAGIFASQVIIPGFGGTGMLTYTKPTPFKGLIGGSETVYMSKTLPPTIVDFTYDNTMNIPGISMTGLLRTKSGMTGNGSMSETVDSVIKPSLSENHTLEVNYDGVEITGTVPSSGSYTVTVDGTDFTVQYDMLNPGMLDYSRILDP